MTKKQKNVLNYLNTVESAHLHNIYANTGTRTSTLLSKMVKQGYINRVKKGYYAINQNYKKTIRTVENYKIN